MKKRDYAYEHQKVNDKARVKILVQILYAQGWKNDYVDIGDLINGHKLAFEDINMSFKKLVSYIRKMVKLGYLDEQFYVKNIESIAALNYNEIPIYASKYQVTKQGLEFMNKWSQTATSLKDLDKIYQVEVPFREQIKEKVPKLLGLDKSDNQWKSRRF